MGQRPESLAGEIPPGSVARNCGREQAFQNRKRRSLLRTRNARPLLFSNNNLFSSLRKTAWSSFPNGRFCLTRKHFVLWQQKCGEPKQEGPARRKGAQLTCRWGWSPGPFHSHLRLGVSLPGPGQLLGQERSITHGPLSSGQWVIGLCI